MPAIVSPFAAPRETGRMASAMSNVAMPSSAAPDPCTGWQNSERTRWGWRTA